MAGALSSWLTAAALGSALACGAPKAGGAPPTPLSVRHVPAVADATVDPATEGPLALSATLFGQVSEGTFGPYLGARTDGRAVALWAALDERGKRRWFSVAFDARGAQIGAARSLCDAPPGLTLARVVPTQGGFAALTTRAEPGGTSVEALYLTNAGALLAGPVLLEQSQSDVVWIEALGSGAKPIGVWASVAHGAAEVHVAAVDFTATPAAMAVRVADSAKAWQAVEFSDGVAIAAVIAGTGENNDTLRVFFLGSDATLISQTDVTSGKHLSPEVDAARVRDRLVLAWVEQDGQEQRLATAAVGADAKRAVAPEQQPALGSQRLFGFVPAPEHPADALLVWENLGQAPRGQRRFRIASVSADAKLDARRAELTFLGEAGERPEFVRKGNGLALLTRALPCPRQGECSAEQPVPSYVELGPDFELLAAEPLRLEPGGQTADLAWGLHCAADSCAALGALPAAPVPVYRVELRARSNSWAAPVRSLARETPRAIDMRSVADTDPLADVKVAAAGDGWWLATLTQFDENTPYVLRKTPAPDGRMGPLRAQLALRPLPQGQKTPGPIQVISFRARAPGGIALAGASDGRALLLWTALDKMRPEVFATLLGRAGKPPLQRMLTQAAGQVSGLAAAVLPQGFMAAWIADPKGEAQVFTARLGPDLAPLSPPAPLARGAGAAVALSLVRRGDTAWVAWVEGNEHEQRLQLARLDPKTGALLGEARLVQRTDAGTLASPVLAAQGDAALLAWIEHPVVGSGGGRAWLVEIDPEGNPRGEPRPVRSSGGDAVAVRLACEAGRCFGSLDCRPPNGARLEAFVWSASGGAIQPGAAAGGGTQPELAARELVWRASEASDAPAFALAGSQIFYGDRNQRRGLLRRVGVEWQ